MDVPATSDKTVYATSVFKVSTALPPKPMARFVGDVTFPDGSSVEPGSVLRKTWKVRNDGEAAWPEGSALAFVSGDRIVPAEHTDVPVPAVTAGAEAELSVKIQAPDATGRHIAYFRLRTAEGTQFGQRLWADIRVAEPENDWQNVSGLVSFLGELTTAPAPSASVETSEVGGADVSVGESQIPEPQATSKCESECTAPPSEDSATSVVVDADAVSSVPSVKAEEVEFVPAPAQQPAVIAREALPAPQPVAPQAAFVPAALAVWSRVWARELRVLADMGFSDEAALLPLLQEHVGVPVSLCPELNGTPAAEGMQRVVMVLLGASGSN